MTGTMTLAAAMECAVAHHKAGRLPEAEALYRAILGTEPRHLQANFNLAVLTDQLGRTEQALPHFKTALEADPTQGQLWIGYADALIRLGRPDAALQVLDQGRRLGLAGPEVDALAARAAAAGTDPFTAAVALHRAGNLAEAERGYRQVLEADPMRGDAHTNLGAVLFELGRTDEAEASYRRALEIDPDSPDTLNNLALMRRRLGQVDGLEEIYRRALAIRPDFAEAHNNLGSLLIDLARLDEAIAHFEHAMEAQPDFIDAHRNLLVALLYHPTVDHEAIFAAHRRFEERHARPAQPFIRPHANGRDPARRLRVGYLSADFRSHPVARNLLPVLRDHDRRAFGIYCYAEVTWEDSVTAEFRSLADGWRTTVGLDDRQVADLIRDDGIDILVCLAARFDRSRPLVCAFKPAPVQISYHDVATSGLAAMDYIISDRILTPRCGPERFTERPLCLPHFYIGEMPPSPPAIRPRPGPNLERDGIRSAHPRHDLMSESPSNLLMRGGFSFSGESPGDSTSKHPALVFGCLNNPSKITGPVLDLWARLLRRVPGSRLYLRYFRLYEVPSLRRRVEDALAAHAVDPSRLIWSVAGGNSPSHLDLYNEIDIALDPFPFSGSTTTFESLIMGVPVVTLRGKAMVANWTASMLDSIGLGNLIARSEEDYLLIAQTLAADADGRQVLRRDLRDRVARSTLCDHRRKTRQIERLYRTVWRRWCGS